MQSPLDTAAKFMPSATGPLALLLNPWFILVFIVWTAAVAGFSGHYAAENAREVAAAAELVRTNAALEAQAKADAAVLAHERDLRMADRTSYNQFIREQNNAKAVADRLIADLRRDVVRLRVPVIRPAGAAEAVPGGPAAAGTGDSGYAELSPDAAGFLVGLLERGDEGIRKHKEVVARYERLRLACEKAGQPITPTTTEEQ